MSWLLKRGKSVHYYIDCMLLASEAVRELAFTSLPLPQHTLLTKVEGQNYFQLPAGFSDVVRVGVRYGDMWWPLPIADRLMPYSNRNGQGDLNPDEFGSDMNTGGSNISWYSGASNAANFSGDDFAPADFQTEDSGGGSSAISPLSSSWYWGDFGIAGPYNIYGSRWYGVHIDVAHGLILVPEGFPFDEIYLQYIGIGTVDNMTEIPLNAQAAIEAYMDWKYAANKRNVGRGEAQDWERKWDNQHRLLRARYNQLGIEDINRIFGDWTPYGRYPTFLIS